MAHRGYFHAALVSIALLLAIGCDTDAPMAPPSSQPATTTAATSPVFAPRDYLELVRRARPAVAATQPLILPLALNEALHVRLDGPIYLCSRGDLWITSPKSPAIEEVLISALDEQTHLTSDRVLYVHWALSADGDFQPHIVRQTQEGLELVSGDQRRQLPQASYQWDRAVSIDYSIYAPTRKGFSIITAEPGYAMKVLHEDLPVPEGGTIETAVHFVFDAEGLLIWAPWQNGKTGSDGILRFQSDTFTRLSPDQGWSLRPLHLVPLLDGSVLQLSTGDDGRLELALKSLTAEEIDEAAIELLVQQLSDIDPSVRAEAFQQLTRYGPGAWPTLERLMPDQPPGAMIQLERLLSNRLTPTLGGLHLVDNAVQVAEWLGDGGLLLFAPAGVRVPLNEQTNEERIVAPAWIVMRPGRAVHLLHEAMTDEASPDKQRFFAFGDEWLVSDEDKGPRRLLGNHVAPMLQSDERQFDHVVGLDRRGRWLFRESADAAQTLVLDPTVPDPDPRLPIWLMWVKNGSVGWDQEDWPTIKRGGAWTLVEKRWRPLDESKNTMITTLDAEIAPATTSPANMPSGPPLAIDNEGKRYYDGRFTLNVFAPDGKQTIWPLPLEVMGKPQDHAHLAVTEDGTILLMNRPGRIAAIEPRTSADEPYAVTATFTHRVPISRDIARFWIDPAQRLVIAYDKERLAICFPDGHVPPEIATMIPASEME